MPVWFNHRSKFPTWAYDLPRPWLVADFLMLSTLTPSMGLTSDPLKGQLVASSAVKPRLHRWVYLAWQASLLAQGLQVGKTHGAFLAVAADSVPSGGLNASQQGSFNLYSATPRTP